MKTATIIGAGGTIGSALATHLEARNIVVTRFARPQLDLAHPASWPALPPADVAYLCAAITKLEACEKDPESSTRINVTHMQLLAEQLLAQGSFVVFLSSNQVFDGQKPFAKITDAPCPMNQYGRQKAAMEAWLLARKNTAVLRLTKVIASPLPILATWREALLRDEKIEAFDDLVFAPIPLAAVVDALTQIGTKRINGITQLSSDHDISYYDIAQLLAKKLNVDSRLVVPIPARTKAIPAHFLPRHGTLARSHFDDIIIPPPEQLVFEKTP